ncbi:MAG: hypothetical protein KGJ23_00685 [Euryarchaeota archaeon]|nr:hypothetical protein [Euryarchaeota archaeon]MDE1835112.1 hypothetical protein [Euryarchaeota archaeon]MDE1880702.1 hypothetical protein [Euryarchaeota archaeon]MDE2044925.1 hypothetical protein [Thermoplasmata archaeon]
MTLSTRLAVLVLTVGFMIEGVGEAFEFVSKQWLLAHLPNALLDIYYIGPATTVVGFLFAFAGRHEWSELHRRHVLHGHKALLIAIALLGSVATVVALLVYEFPGAAVPILLPWVMGVAVAVGLGSSFLSYLLIGFHITTQRGKACLVAALAWGVLVSVIAGYEVGANFVSLVASLRTGNLSVANSLSSLLVVTTILFVSYFLLMFAYRDAYQQLLRGILPKGHTPAKHYRGPPQGVPPAAPSVPPSGN